MKRGLLVIATTMLTMQLVAVSAILHASGETLGLFAAPLAIAQFVLAIVIVAILIKLVSRGDAP